MNLQSDNLAIRLGKMLAGFFVVFVLVMLDLTVVFSLQGGYEDTNATAHVKHCENKGPITWRGFGNNWNCTATFREDGTGETWRDTVDFNLFTPEEIGTPQRVSVGNYGGRVVTSDDLEYHQPGWLSPGVAVWIWLASSAVILFPALWIFAKSAVWALPQKEQRELWEKIHGNPEERAAKKEAEQRRDREFRQKNRARSAARKEARRSGQLKREKEQRKAARKRMREIKRQRGL